MHEVYRQQPGSSPATVVSGWMPNLQCVYLDSRTAACPPGKYVRRASTFTEPMSDLINEALRLPRALWMDVAHSIKAHQLLPCVAGMNAPTSRSAGGGGGDAA